MQTLRPLVVDDAAAAADLIRRAFAAQSLATDPPSAALRENAGSIAAAIAEGGGAGAVAGGRLIGVVLWAEKSGLYFGRLAVDPAWRGTGIGKRLVAAVEAEASRRGLSRVHLSTRLPLLDNRRFFAACGFRETELRAHDGYASPTSVVMEKHLDGPARG